MTSTTLNYKGGFKAAFVKTFKQQLPGAVIMLVLAFFVSVFRAASTIIRYSSALFTKKYDITEDSILLINYFGGVCAVFSLFLAMQMFKEIYSKRACDTFFALPIKRSDYFNAKFLYGVLINLISLVIAGAVHIVILLCASTKLITYTIDFKLFAGFAAALVFTVLCFYAIFIFCAVLAGRRVQYFFFVIIALFAPPCITDGVIGVINRIWGADANSFILSVIHPVKNMFMTWEANIEYVTVDKKNIFILIVSAAEAAALYLLSYFVFKKRKAEIAEFTPSGKVIPMLFLAAVITAAITQTASKVSFYLSIVFSVVFAVIAQMIFSGVFYKKVFAKNTAITFAASTAVCILFSCAVLVPGHSNYVKYVPEAEEIERVELVEGYDTGYSYALYYLSSYADSYYNSTNSYTFVSAENIDNAIALHQKIVDDETMKKGKAINSDTWGDMMDYDYEYENCYDCVLVYHLKNGETIRRKYSVPAKMISDEMFKLMKTEEGINQFGVTAVEKNDFLYATFESETYSDINNYNAPIKNSKDLTEQEFFEFLEGYKKDILSFDKKEFLDYLGGCTAYYVDLYSSSYYEDTYSEDNDYDEAVPEDSYWIYVKYCGDNANDKEREYLKSLDKLKIDNLQLVGDDYNDLILDSQISVFYDYKNTYKYAQSHGLLN